MSALETVVLLVWAGWCIYALIKDLSKPDSGNRGRGFDGWK